MSDTPVLDYRLICVSESRGLQRYTARLANALAATGAVRLSVAGQERLLTLLDPGVAKLVIPAARRSPYTFFAIGRAIFTHRRTVLHYQGVNLVTLLLLALAARLGWRVVVTPHNVETHFRNRAYNAIKWSLWRSYSMIVLHTRAELTLVPEDLRLRVALLPHGEYSPSDDPAPASDMIVEAVSQRGPYILAPGFVRNDKNLGYLIENASLISRCGYSLVVSGRNQSSLSSESIAAAAIYFDSFLPDADLDYLISHASAVVLPYDKVSESGILHQALSVGTPVIASDLAGFRERIREGETGWFLNELSSQALDSALSALKSAQLNRKEIARLHRDAFSWDAIAPRLLEEIDARRLRHK